MLKVPLRNGGYTLVDDEDRWVLDRKWYKSPFGYVVAHKRLILHREIMQVSSGQEIDHINRDKLDNRKSNLRICTRAENNRNRGTFSNNKTGLKGAYKRRNKYQSIIRHNGKTFYLGTFDTAELAHKAYINKAKELHGVFFYEYNI